MQLVMSQNLPARAGKVLLKLYFTFPVAHLIELFNGDGLLARASPLDTACAGNAARFERSVHPRSTDRQASIAADRPGPNNMYSAIHMAQAERVFLTNDATFRPIERTLLTGGITTAAMRSLSTGRREALPGLEAVRYEAGESVFANE